MEQQDIIAGLEARAKAVGLTISKVCSDAGVHPTTFSRWKRSEKNPNPVGASLRSLTAIDAEISKYEQSSPEGA